MNKVGIHYAVWGTEWDVDFCKRIERAKKVGFDYIVITPQQYFWEFDKEKMDRIKKSAIDNEIELEYCIGFPKELDMASKEEQARKAGVERAKKMVEAVAYMGGNMIGGILYSYWPAVFNEPISEKPFYLDRAVKSVKEVINVASDNGITFAIEAVNRYEHFIINTIDECLDFLERVDSPNCKILLDVYHANIEEKSVESAIMKAGDNLVHMHFSENNRQIPGRGEHMPWDKIAKALKEIDYKGGVTLEPFVMTGGPVGRDIKTWRNLVPDISLEGIDKELESGLDFVRNLLK